MPSFNFDFSGTDFSIQTVNGGTTIPSTPFGFTRMTFEDEGVVFTISVSAGSTLDYDSGVFVFSRTGVGSGTALLQIADTQLTSFSASPSVTGTYVGAPGFAQGFVESIQIFAGNTVSPGRFSITVPASGATSITFTVSTGAGILFEGMTADLACFGEGTLIDTPFGPRAVETLSEGDLVLTDQGPEPLIWTGATKIDPRFAPESHHPIRITKGALGANMPDRDLTLSPDHAIALDGLLITAGALANRTTIRRVECKGPFTYHHIATARHSLLTAQNTPCESYTDNTTGAFDTRPKQPIPEMDRPRVTQAAQRPNRAA